MPTTMVVTQHRADAKEGEIVSVDIQRTSEDCPFLNDRIVFALRPGEVLWLRGSSGAGKSYCCMHISNLATLPGASVSVRWDESIPAGQRIGFLFQKGVLLDSLNLSENIALALRASNGLQTIDEITREITCLLEAVGLSAQVDGPKMPGQLSGGMLRRAALAQILAQHKRLIILDEPFVGLDPEVAADVVQLILSVTASRPIAIILISHLQPLALELKPTLEVHLERARSEVNSHPSVQTLANFAPAESI